MVLQALLKYLRITFLLTLGLGAWLSGWGVASADTTLTLFNSFAGNLNFIGTQRTLRTQPDTGNSCAINAGTTTATLAGLPAGATVTAAYLYWAASGSTPDYNVTFEGSAIAADPARRYTATFTLGSTYDYFSGVVDVTATVAAKGNGTYSFTGLTVDNGNPWCASSAVLGGWALLVVYSLASEDFRVVNVYEGFQHFRGSSITLTPSNFLIPTSPINGKDAHLTWEGDVGNSAPLGGFNEELTFNGNTLADANNPVNNQFNSVSTINSPVDTASYGVDFDVYDVTAYLAAGQTSATTVYSSGGDLVLLSSQIISTTNTPVADLALSMTRSGNLVPGMNASYTLNVVNNGPLSEPGPITIVDTLPAGLSYVSASGTGWSCSAAGQVVTCNRTGSLANGASAPALTLTVAVSPTASGTLTNSATVSGQRFDNDSSNDTATDSYTIPGSAYAYYAMDEFVWNGTANEVADSSGNNRHGVRVGNADTVFPGKVCRGGDIPDDTSAIDTGIDVNAALGNRGSITFWYKSDTDWNDGQDRMLLDASNDLGNGNADKYFFLVKEGGGELRFRLEDSGDTDTQARTGGNSFAANTWVHIGITWDLPNDRTEIYVNGVLQDASTTNVNGTLGDTDTLYLGDNRTGGVGGGGSGYTTQSANGVLDEARIYDTVLNAAAVTADMNATHTCPTPPPGLNYFDITVPAYATVCGPATITITARDAGGGVVTNYTGLVNLSTSTGNGDWAVKVAAGTLNNGAADDGAATYQFVLADAGTIQLSLATTNQGNLTVTVQDTALSVSNTSASIDFRRGNRTLLITNDPIQVAARPQAMTVARLQNDCSIDTGVNGTRDVRAWITRDAVSDPGGAAPSINGVALPNADPGADNLTGANGLTFVNGVASFNLNTTDVGKYVLNLRDGNDRGTSDPITTRPFGLGFTAIQQGATANPGGTATGGAKFVAAGDTFSATVGAYRWSAADDGNNDGVPDAGSDITNNGLTVSYAWTTAVSVSTTPGTYTPAAGSVGTLGGSTSIAPASFSAAPAGSATVNDLTYSEVGSMRLRANATNYLNTPGVNLAGLSGVIGRFFPDHFALVSGSITAACGTMTYMGQPNLGLAYNIEARNKANVKTNNYISPGYNVGSVALMAENNNDGTNLVARLSGTPSATWTTGTYNATTAAASFTRPAGNPDGAFDNLLIGVQVSDADGPVIQSLDINPTTTGDCVAAANCTGKSIALATRVRYGRVAIQNAYGSELLDLAMPLTAQYYADSNTGFVANTLDVCTNVTLGFSNWQDNLDPSPPPPPPEETCVQDSGSPGLSGIGCQTPGPLANRFREGAGLINGDFNLHLRAPGSGNDGSVDVTVTLQSWLQYDWTGSGPSNPVGQARFGVYEGSPRQIYIRELY